MSPKQSHPLGEYNAEIEREHAGRVNNQQEPPEIAEARKKANGIDETIADNTVKRNQLRIKWAFLANDKMKGHLMGKQVKEGSELHIVMGLPASGKSSQIAEKLAIKHGAVLVDRDITKEEIPEYRGGIGASAVHMESAMITETIFEHALMKGQNIVYPRVYSGLSNGDLLKDIQLAKSVGYKVFLYMVETPVDEAKSNAVERFKQTGRFVDPRNIEDAGLTPHRNFNSIVANHRSDIDGYAVYANKGRKISEIYREGI